MSDAPSYLEGLVPVIGLDAVLDILASSERDAGRIIELLEGSQGTGVETLKGHLHALKGIALNLGLDESVRVLASVPQDSIPEAKVLAKKIPELLFKELGDLRGRLQATDRPTTSS